MALPVAPVDGTTYTFGGVDHVYTAATDSYAVLTAANAAVDVTTWTTATRPATPTTGQSGYNSTIPQFEYWDGAAWQAAGGAAVTSWTTLTRPAIPDVGQEGLNTDLGYLEYWDGLVWSASSSTGSDGGLSFFYAEH